MGDAVAESSAEVDEVTDEHFEGCFVVVVWFEVRENIELKSWSFGSFV